MFGRRKPEQCTRVDIRMNTAVSQTVSGTGSPAAALTALREVGRLEGLHSRFRPDSDIGRLNRAAGGDSVKAHPETAHVLRLALEVARLSGGAFDVTACPLVSLWSVTSANPVLPSEEAIARARTLVDYESLSVDERGRRARLARVGQMVDLGGIAKGYAADRALAVYRRRGVASAMIDLGGNVAVLGSKEDSAPWNVGIQDPDAPRGDCLGFLSLTDKSVVTSGDYERFFELGGRRYHHIIDPRTGYPAESGLRSVTVVASESIVADAMSTALFVLGMERGLAMLDAATATGDERFHRVEALFVTSAKEVYLTEGLADLYTSLTPTAAIICRTTPDS